MEHQDQQNFSSQNCAICYTDFKVPMLESGQLIYTPFSVENEYLWTKQLHQGCIVNQSLICLPCIKTRLAMLVDGNNPMYCSACSQTGLDVEMVLQLLPEDKRDVVFMKELRQNGLKKCSNKACEASFVFERSTNCADLITNCPECSYPYCAQCGDQFHGALSCNTYVEALDIMQTKVRKNGYRYCPHCKTPVERISGCNHMVCTQCSREWCYDCEQPFDSSHSCVQTNIARLRRLESLTRIFDKISLSGSTRGYRGRGRGRGAGRGRGRGRGRGNAVAAVAENVAEPQQAPVPAPRGHQRPANRRGRGQFRGRGGRGRGGRGRGEPVPEMARPQLAAEVPQTA